MSEAQVQAVAAQRAQAGGESMDLLVPVERLLAAAGGGQAFGVEALDEIGNRSVEALGDGREVPLVAGDQGRVGLGGEVVGEGECAGRQGVTSSAPV